MSFRLDFGFFLYFRDSATWEPEEHLDGSPEALTYYFRRSPAKKQVYTEAKEKIQRSLRPPAPTPTAAEEPLGELAAEAGPPAQSLPEEAAAVAVARPRAPPPPLLRDEAHPLLRYLYDPSANRVPNKVFPYITCYVLWNFLNQ